ncbi:MAG: alcohol dehydrogenase catalytic domain-containing protein [Anaerolineae bacterium]|nr:alcohol dehydrogenase catalytic domain-containing protein [Anaerolineae bacterium]
MKGIFVTAKNQTAILDLPEPAIGPYEALVQVEACGICNSTDWKIIHGEFVSGTFPVLLGHESAGSVIQVGEKVRSFKVGDLVLRSTLRDGHVPYPGGRSCWGGFVERAIVADVWAQQGAAYNSFPHPQQVVPPSISAVQAATSITLKETLSCLYSTDVQPGQSLAIVGTGPVAQTLVLFAKLSGISPVVVLGRRAGWAGRFAALGADGYATAEDTPPEVRVILDHGGFDRAIEAVGARDALARCLEVIAPAGKINIYGVAPESEPHLSKHLADPRVFHGKVAEAETHEQLFRWVNEGKVDLDDWISHTLPWRDYRRGFEMVQDKTANKVILTWQSDN